MWNTSKRARRLTWAAVAPAARGLICGGIGSAIGAGSVALLRIANGHSGRGRSN